MFSDTNDLSKDTELSSVFVAAFYFSFSFLYNSCPEDRIPMT